MSDELMIISKYFIEKENGNDCKEKEKKREGEGENQSYASVS